MLKRCSFVGVLWDAQNQYDFFSCENYNHRGIDSRVMIMVTVIMTTIITTDDSNLESVDADGDENNHNNDTPNLTTSCTTTIAVLSTVTMIPL